MLCLWVITATDVADRNGPGAHAVPTAPVNGDGSLRRRLLGYGDTCFLRLDGVRGACGQVIKRFGGGRGGSLFSYISCNVVCYCSGISFLQ